MNIPYRFSNAQLERIIDEATIYMCACPAQVAVQIRELRELIKYQHDCEQQPDNQKIVHQRIAATAIEAHTLMEQCMDDILTIEGWDRQTLQMPAGLRQLRDDAIRRDVACGDEK